ncbi:MAG: hypothetical protein M3Y06_12265 [Actinomycetota bacterium]|nr:hypothetical protein [Actinomycetota bacterium]
MCLIVGLALVVWLVVSVVTGPGLAGWFVGVVLVLVGTSVGLSPWLAWHGLELRIDDTGVLFGSETRRTRPPFPVGLARQRYAVPWSLCGDAAIVEGQAAATVMRGFLGRQQPTTRNGFFVRKGAAAHLSLFISDTAQTPLPRARVLRSGTFTMTSVETTYHPSRRWVFPLRDSDEVVAAFAARGIPIVRTTEPAVPVPTTDWDG